MSNVDLLALSIGVEPDDFTAHQALIDALMEERDLIRAEAELYAARVVDAARNSRDLAHATQLLAVGSPDRAQLLAGIIEACSVGRDEGISVVVIAGDGPPQLTTSSEYDGGEWWLLAFATVGAGWVLRYRRDHPGRFPAVRRGG